MPEPRPVTNGNRETPDRTSRRGALAGVRVLDLGQEKGAYCGKLLADLGADVIKVEPPAGDPGRRQPPFKDDEPGLERSLAFAYYNTSKRGITLNLETRDGQAILRALVQTADILLEAFAPEYLEGLGLGAASLRHLRPELVVTSLTPFGQDGPYRHYRANDLVAFAGGGVMYLSGDPHRPPVTAPGQHAYDMGSLHAAACALMALWARRRTGLGQEIDVSMQECLATEEHTISRYAHEDHVIRRDGSQHESAAPGGIYPCRDGYVHLFITNSSPGVWERFLEWIGSPEELRHPHWQDAMHRRAYVDELRPHILAFTTRHDKQELMERGQEHHIPCIAVNTPADFLRNPHIVERRFFVETEHPVLGQVPFPGPPYRLSETPWRLQGPSPRLGEHNREIYGGELGLACWELDALHQAAVI